jgi:hypothetical protein
MAVEQSFENGDSIELENLKENYRNLKAEIENRQNANLAAIDDAKVSSLKKYEYLTVDNVDDSYLNEKGQRGWELVNFASFTTGFGLGGNTSMTVQMRFVLKRELIALPSHQEEEPEAITRLIIKRKELAKEINRMLGRSE